MSEEMQGAERADLLRHKIRDQKNHDEDMDKDVVEAEPAEARVAGSEPSHGFSVRDLSSRVSAIRWLRISPQKPDNNGYF